MVATLVAVLSGSSQDTQENSDPTPPYLSELPPQCEGELSHEGEAPPRYERAPPEEVEWGQPPPYPITGA